VSELRLAGQPLRETEVGATHPRDFTSP
jgi:hypothetical protein